MVSFRLFEVEGRRDGKGNWAHAKMGASITSRRISKKDPKKDMLGSEVCSWSLAAKGREGARIETRPRE